MKPNILFLISDEHGFRYMNHVKEENGGERINTPNFDKLASQAAVLSNAYCQMPLCTPSRMCIFTGTEVQKCGAWGNESILRPELPTLAKTLESNDYDTCLVGKYHLGGTNQFGGFMHRPYGDLTGKCGHQWEPILNDDRMSMESRTSNVGISDIPESLMQENIVCNEAISYLREHKSQTPDKPYFLCTSFSRPHFPLTAPKRFIDMYWPNNITEPKIGPTGDAYNHPMSVGMREGFEIDRISYQEMMRARASYFACVSFLDEIIGDFLARLEREGLLDNTIVVYLSDHGEMAGEHGVWWKNGWYEGCTRVPLIISLPEHRCGKLEPSIIDTPVGLIDLFPTMCKLTNTDIPSGLDGEDISPAILGEDSISDDRPIFSDNLTPRWGEGTQFRMVRLKDYKYVVFKDAPPLMFNLKNDPMEQKNLVKSNDIADIKMRKTFEEICKKTIDFDEVENDRTVRDGKLNEEYKLSIDTNDTLNLYIMPDGRLIKADEILYNSTVLANDYKDVFIK